jgi:hypothetical protein
MNGVRVGTHISAGTPLWIDERWLTKHAAIFGGSGFGKTFLSYVLIREQLARGCSLVAIDPKLRTVLRLRGLCQEMGIPPENVRVIDGNDPEGTPGINPFRAGIHPDAAAAGVIGILRKAGAFEGAIRVEAFLKAAVPVAAWHGLPLDSLHRLLRDPWYLSSVLDSPTVGRPGAAYRSAVAYLRSDFAEFKDSDRKETLRSIRLRLGFLEGSDMLLAAFGAAEDGLGLDALFTERGRGALLVSMEAGRGTTEEDGAVIAGIVVNQLFAAARREPGPVPVVLAVDEVRKLSEFLEDGFRDVVNMAREARIRLIVVAQHPGQLPPGAREDVLTSSTVKAFFNPGSNPESLSEAARTLARKDRQRPAADPEPEVVAAPAFRGRIAARVQGGTGRLVPVEAEFSPPRTRLEAHPDHVSWALGRFMDYARPGRYLAPLCDEGSGRPVRDLIAVAAPGSRCYLGWHAGSAWLEIEPPPGAKRPPRDLPPNERWEGVLALLDERQAVLDVGTDYPIPALITQASPGSDATAEYVAASRSANGAVPYEYPAPPSAGPSPEPKPDTRPDEKPQPRAEPATQAEPAAPAERAAPVTAVPPAQEPDTDGKFVP